MTITPPERQVTSVPCTARRSARISPAPAPRQTSPARPHPPGQRGLRVGQREIAGDLRRAVRLLGSLPRQRHVRRIQLRHRPAADEPQVGAQCPARHAGQPRRACAVNRSITDGCSSTSGTASRPSADAVVGELGRRPQQVLRPLLLRPAPPGRPRPGRMPPPAATPTSGRHRRYSRRPRSAPSSPGGTGRPAAYCRYTVRHDRTQGPCHPETVRVAASHQAEASKIAAELAAIARTGMVLPGTDHPAAHPLRPPQLRLPRRPAPAARPVLAVDPQGRRENGLPLAQRRPAPRLHDLDRQRPAASRTARPARGPRRRRPRGRPPLGTLSSQDKCGHPPLNLWAALQPDPVRPGQP